MTRPCIPAGLLALAWLLLSAPLWAQAAAPVKIGVIDVQRILMESKAAKKARAEFTGAMEVRRAQLAAREREIQALDRELKDPKAGLSEEARRQKAEALARDVKEFRRMDADMAEELKKKDVELTQKLLTEIRRIVQDFAKSGQYTLILEKAAVVTADEAVDITPQILKRYDALR